MFNDNHGNQNTSNEFHCIEDVNNNFSNNFNRVNLYNESMFESNSINVKEVNEMTLGDSNLRKLNQGNA